MLNFFAEAVTPRGTYGQTRYVAVTAAIGLTSWFLVFGAGSLLFG